MSDVHDGRISPRALDAIWVATPHKNDMDARLAEALKNTRGEVDARGASARSARVPALKEARARWAKLAGEAAWPAIGPGPPLRKGAKGVRVRALRQRLAATGDLPQGDGDRFDGALEAAVKRAQERFGRVADGVVGEPETLELNVPASGACGRSSSTWSAGAGCPLLRRALPAGQHPRVHAAPGRGRTGVLTWRRRRQGDEPDAGLQRHHDPGRGQSDLERAAVDRDQGDRAALAEDPDYSGEAPDAARRRGRDEVDPAVSISPDSARAVIVRQDAGEDNALGRMKFVLPNSFDIYLHDTPAGALFALEERSFSHGCIRVAEPLVLAHAVLQGRAEADTARLRRLIDDGERRPSRLPKPLPGPHRLLHRDRQATAATSRSARTSTASTGPRRPPARPRRVQAAAAGTGREACGAAPSLPKVRACDPR
jgi:hypothetical protein